MNYIDFLTFLSFPLSYSCCACLNVYLAGALASS